MTDSKIETTPRVVEFAAREFVVGVSLLLDDPEFLLHGDGEARRIFFAEQRALAADLGLDFDELCDQQGSPYERDRLKACERGEQ